MFWGNRVKITESNMIRTHHHRMTEMVVCLSDTGKHDIGGRTYSFKKGRTFFLPESVPHLAKGSKKEPAEISFICFELHTDIEHFTPVIRNIIKEMHGNKQYASVSNESNKKNLELVKQIFQEINTPSPLNQTMVGALVSQLIINHSRSFANVAEPEQETYSAKIANLCSWITANFAIDLSLDEAARRTGMSRSLFSRNFRNHTGMSLVDFITSVRISNAIRLLTSTEAPIEDIAMDCGFRNLGYFYRMFQRHTNSTPRKLRTFVIETGQFPLV